MNKWYEFWFKWGNVFASFNIVAGTIAAFASLTAETWLLFYGAAVLFLISKWTCGRLLDHDERLLVLELEIIQMQEEREDDD